jgi:hypothetical protein
MEHFDCATIFEGKIGSSNKLITFRGDEMPGLASILGLDHFESFHCIDDVAFHKGEQHAWKRGHALGAIH